MHRAIQNTTSKKAVFFLGAGFSKAVIPSFPTLQELTDEIRYNFEGEKQSVKNHFYTEIPEQYKQNIEHLLTFLSSNLPFKTDVQMSADDALYKDLKNKIANYFEQRTYNLKDFNKGTLFCHYLDKYKIPCITLNYDLLLEKLFVDYFARQKFPSITTYEYFYKSPVTSLYYRQKTGAFGFASVEDELQAENRFPAILKLHGSINWLYAGISQTDPVYCKIIPFNPNDEYLTKDLQPMIVPPVMDKTSIYNHTILKAVWRQAYDALKEAKEIYICGFSFPETDLSVRFLFQSALENNINLQKIYFINTGNNLEKKKKHFSEALKGYEHKLNFDYCCEDSLNKFIDKIIAPQVQI